MEIPVAARTRPDTGAVLKCRNGVDPKSLKYPWHICRASIPGIITMDLGIYLMFGYFDPQSEMSMQN